MPIISPTAISPHRIGGKSWRTYWEQRGVTPGADATLITTEINAALQTHSYVKITEAGIYDIDGTIYIPSNTTLEFVAGCTLRKATGSSFYHMIANNNIQTLTADTNVTLIGNGLNCDINGIDNVGTPAGPSQRGHLMFYLVNGLTVTGIETTTIDENQFFIHVAEVSNVVMRDIDAEGWKDGIHFGVAHNVLLEDIRTATGDDGIALNAGDYYVSNPTVGNITNVTIRRWTDDVYAGQGGSGCLLLTRSWENWTSGHDYLINDYVNNAGNIYQKKNEGTQTAAIAPTHASGSVTGADGIEWAWLQSGTIDHADVIGISFEDCTWASGRPFIRTVGSAVSTPMRSFYPGTGSQSIVDNIVIDNLTYTPGIAGLSVFLCDVDTGSIEFRECNFTIPDGSNLCRIVPRAETFTIDEIIFNGSAINLEADEQLVTMPALTYNYAVNTITIKGGCDIRTDDSTRASLVAYPAAGVIGVINMENSSLHHLVNIVLLNAKNAAELTINANNCVFDEACARLIWLYNTTNSTVNFNAVNCFFEETSLAMFDNNQASSNIIATSSGSTGESIPNLNTANVDVSECDLVLALGDNIIKNGKFREGALGWNAITGAIAWDVSESLKYTSSGGSLCGIGQAIANPLSNYLRLSFRAKSPTLNVTMKTYNNILTPILNPAMTPEWQTYVFEGNRGAASSTMYLLAASNLSNGDIIFFDDIEVVQYV